MSESVRALPFEKPLITATEDELKEAVRSGREAEQIYHRFLSGQCCPELLNCRLIVGSAGDLAEAASLREKLTAGEPAEGEAPVMKIGLIVVPDSLDDGSAAGFRVRDLAEAGRLARKYRGVSVRGCLIRADLKSGDPVMLARFIRASYETAKQMTVRVPCEMPYILMEGLKEAYRGLEARGVDLSDVDRAAAVVYQQNETAFYAKLLAD